MTKKQKKTRRRIVTALVLFLALELAEHLVSYSVPSLIWPVLYLIPYGIIGWDVLWKAVRTSKTARSLTRTF